MASEVEDELLVELPPPLGEDELNDDEDVERREDLALAEAGTDAQTAEGEGESEEAADPERAAEEVAGDSAAAEGAAGAEPAADGAEEAGAAAVDEAAEEDGVNAGPQRR